MGHAVDAEMPEGWPGRFVWKGEVTTLHPGTNSLAAQVTPFWKVLTLWVTASLQ
jgi:hypothetical protein